MGNLIKDFWTYKYKSKSYYGICEVVMGEDLQQKRHIKKYETHIEKALKFMMKPGNDFVSHMSIQKYTSFLKDRVFRETDEETYYPFFMEFEPKVSERSKQIFEKQYKEAVGEALRVVSYTINVLGMAKEDVLIMINNARSVYVMFNPRSYGMKPSSNTHKIYEEMYKAIDEEIGLNYVDRSLYSHYGLMKTPNCYYKGGYFTSITSEQLKKLYDTPKVKSILTSHKKSLDYYVPARTAPGMTMLYQDACEVVYENKIQHKKQKQLTYISSCPASCIKYIENNEIEKGCRNHALVSVAIYYKNQGYTEDQIIERLKSLAAAWKHDESYSSIVSKVRSIFRYNTQFSCEKAKQVLEIDMDSICASCPYNKKNAWKHDKIAVHSDVINELWENKASTRHYIAYLELSRKNLFGRWFDTEKEDVSDRTIRELCRHTNNLIREKSKGLVYIDNKAAGNVYYLPTSFIEEQVHITLGEYLKHYLKLIIKGYKSKEKYILLRVSKEKVMRDLAYSEISGVYKFVKKLIDLGLLVEKRGKIVALYFESYKVKDFKEYKERKASKIVLDQVRTNKIAASGESCVNLQVNFDNYRAYRRYPGTNDRGSPG